MIFVTLGTQKFQLNRLLKQLDKYIEQGQITDKVIAQIGYSDYLPKRYEYIDFLNKTEFDEMIEAHIRCDSTHRPVCPGPRR